MTVPTNPAPLLANRDALAAVLARHRDWGQSEPGVWLCVCGEHIADTGRDIVAAHREHQADAILANLCRRGLVVTLPEFLLARIAEDEGDAPGYPSPTSWLAECEAKRQIIQDCAQYEDEDYASTDGLALRTLLRLATIYADHPDHPDYRDVKRR